MKVISRSSDRDRFKITINFECILDAEQCTEHKNPSIEDIVEEIKKYPSVSKFIEEWCLEDGDPKDGEFIVTVSKA